MKKVLAFLSALVLVLGLIQVSVPATDNNLISNGDFETSKYSSSTASAKYWNGFNYSRISRSEHSEQGYFMSVTGSSARSCNHDSITVKANTYYCYSAKIYREDATGAAYIDMLPDGGGAYFAGTQAGTNETGRWITVSCIFNSGNHTVMVPHLAAEGLANGKYVYFDDVKLIELAFPQGGSVDEPKAAFTVATDSTTASFAVTDHKLYITQLSHYITQPKEMALIGRISDKEVIWEFNHYEPKTIANGIEHTVTFLSSDHKYELCAVLTQRDGTGPIEFNQYITGLTEGIAVAYPDIISANITIDADGEATLYRFSRSRVNDGSDPYFSQGVLTDTLRAGSSVFSSVENYYTTNHSVAGILPYQVLEIDGTHGVYFGHYWSFGKILVRMNDSNEITFTAYLGDNSRKKITRAQNEELHIPGFFIGTYEGSVDNGSNQMKNWFWDYKMTHSLRENENEPYIEIGVISDRVSGIHALFDMWPDMADYVNILKLDYGWTIADGTASREDIESEDKWVPNNALDKYGKADGSIDMGIYAAIQENLLSDQSENDIFFSLYMADTFEGVDIGTKEGREKQLEALKVRMRPEDNDYGIGYDYWRSDYEVEQSYDYDDHEGLLYILDEMIQYSKDFRYEHCMGGGSLKDFTTLERMTFMTTEDSALPLNHRMSLYANTYMINPLQLKADINMGLTSRDYKDAVGGNILENGKPGYTDETYVKYALRTGMLGAMMVSFNAEGYQYGNNMEIIKEHYDLYNNTHREILRNADVYHILSSPTGWDYADWDGIQYYNSEINKGVVQLFKENETAPDSKTIVLDGLNENAMYSLTFLDRTGQSTIKSGAQLMTEGITVRGMDTQYASELIYIEPYITDNANPTITDVVAINHTQFKITTSEPVTVKNDACFALFVSQNGTVGNLTEKDGRFGGTITPANTPATEFIWTINAGGNATDVISAATAAGHQVYFGLNGNASTGTVDVARAVDSEGRGFVPNLAVTGSSHAVYGLVAKAFTPNVIVSVGAISDTHLEITFAKPLEFFTGAVMLGVLNTAGTDIYNDDGVLDDHAIMKSRIVDGKLLCWLEEDKAGMSSEDARNITKIVAAIESAYPGHSAGIGLLEANVENIKNTGYLEQVSDVDRMPLKATGARNGRDLCAAAISVGVAQVGDALYFSMKEIMANVMAGDEIDLLQDVKITDSLFVLDAGVTLDLNGHALTVNHVLTFGDIIDSTEGVGKLIPTPNARVILSPENVAMPLYDADGYRFFSYQFKGAGPKNGTADSVRFGVQLTFTNADAYALLAKDATTTIEMDLAVTKDGKVTNLAFTFKPGTLEQYRDAWNNRTDLTKTPTLVLTVSGIEGIDSITCSPSIKQSTTTVIRTGSALSYSPIPTE